MNAIVCTICLSLVLVVHVAAQDTPYPTTAIEEYYDLKFTDAERDSMQSQLQEMLEEIRVIHSYSLENSVSPALQFNPYPPGFLADTVQRPVVWNLPADVSVPKKRSELAFMPVYQLAELIRTRKITSTELTELYLDRLEKYGDKLKCIVTVLRERALQQARQADAEIAAGKYRGPLHGIPYGVKDLLSVKGVRTTWGAMPYLQQYIDETATVVEKLDSAGAVLVAKLSMGSLAMGDVWFGGKTRNPWNLEEGSSGSSAGSAAATAAGLVAFSIGSETWGSIVSPSSRCGTTGLRPTYGLVSRHGAMALSWSMDKLGPICRTALDCALVFDAIRGPDGKDGTVTAAPFNYDARKPLKELKVGYIKSYFDADSVNRENNMAILRVIRGLGIEPAEVELPDNLPVGPLSIILTAEAAAAFDELTRTDRDTLLVRQTRNAWPNYFRAARFIPAVEYINALRLRELLIREYHKATKDYDVIVTPSFGGSQLLMTNLTGHPCLVLPHGFDEKGSPVSITLLGRLQGEAALIALGRAIQEATPWEDKHPPLFK